MRDSGYLSRYMLVLNALLSAVHVVSYKKAR